MEMLVSLGAAFIEASTDAIGGWNQRRTDGQVLAATAGPTLRPNRIAVRRWMRGVTRAAVPSLVPNSVCGVVCRVIAETARQCRAVSKEVWPCPATV
jgi:hypothetical protein